MLLEVSRQLLVTAPPLLLELLALPDWCQSPLPFQPTEIGAIEKMLIFNSHSCGKGRANPTSRPVTSLPRQRSARNWLMGGPGPGLEL